MLQSPDLAPPAPPAPPTPPAPGAPIIVDGSGQVILGADPVAQLRAAKAQVEVLREQLEHLEEKRSELVQEIRELREQGIDYKGVEGRIASIDVQLRDVQTQLGEANLRTAQAAAVPGAEIPIEPQFVHNDGPPEGVIAIGVAFVIFVLAPLSFAMARRLWKRTPVAAAPELSASLDKRLAAIEQAVESTAVEVERIGEGQRFMSRLFTEQRALGEGAARPVEVAAREKVREPR